MHWIGAQREKRFAMHFSMMQNPPCVMQYVNCRASPGRHVLTSHLTPTRCLWASPWHGQTLPCGALGSLDHLTKWAGQEAGSRWGTDQQMKREMCPIKTMLLLDKKAVGSVYFFPDLFLPPLSLQNTSLKSYPPGTSQWMTKPHSKEKTQILI